MKKVISQKILHEFCHVAQLIHDLTIKLPENEISLRK